MKIVELKRNPFAPSPCILFEGTMAFLDEKYRCEQDSSLEEDMEKVGVNSVEEFIEEMLIHPTYFLVKIYEDENGLNTENGKFVGINYGWSTEEELKKEVKIFSSYLKGDDWYLKVYNTEADFESDENYEIYDGYYGSLEEVVKEIKSQCDEEVAFYFEKDFVEVY